MAAAGLTLHAETVILNHLLRSDPVYGRLYKGDPGDGTMNLSAWSTRSLMTFGAPDSAGVFDLSAPTTWGTFLQAETLWGVGIWDAPTAGNCLLLREFAEAKNVFIGDDLVLEKLPISLPVTGL